MPISRSDAAHLLSRTGFGGTDAEIIALMALGWEAAVDQVLDTSGWSPPGPPPGLPYGNDDTYQKWVLVNTWWIDQMRSSAAPIVEKLTLFWHGHFATSADKVRDMRLMWDQNDLLRRNCLGSFRDLCQAVALDPAMLIWLDNETNVAGEVQENWGRELMELFACGIGNYTENDVITVARAWTGHNLNEQNQYAYRSEHHDNGSKSLFGSSQNWSGPATIDELCFGSRAVATSKFISRKLWSFLAAPDPSDSLVDTLATVFRSSSLSIRELVKAILLRPEFRSTEVKTGLVRSPTEFVVATLSRTGLGTGDAHPEWYMKDMGQRLFWPPNVAGWKDNAYWISSASFWGRARWATHLRWQTRDAGLFDNIENLTPSDGASQIFDQFGIFEPSANTRSALEAWLTTERTGSDRWALAPNSTVMGMLSPDFQLA